MSDRYPKNIPQWEMEHSDTALRMGLDNSIPANLASNAIRVAWWLQDLRNKLCNHFEKRMPVVITSGYRGFALNSALKGSKTSAHMKALAADIRVPGLTTRELTMFIIEHMDGYDQVIDEFGRWVHIGLSLEDIDPRCQVLQAERGAKGVVYTFFNASEDWSEAA